ncbi:MAG: aldehyde dehydrogenase family protein, partial [Anaerolineae bacterium]|nr:aldehyde dehydrogenase family protein [Anaerolineae bacterium]
MTVDRDVKESATQNRTGAPETPNSRDVITSISPATGRRLGETPVTAPGDAERLVRAAREAQTAWFDAGLSSRIRALRRLKDAFYRRMDPIIAALVNELGKPPVEALTEYWTCIETLAFFERLAAPTLAPRRTFTGLAPHRMHWIERRPFGVVLVIGP